MQNSFTETINTQPVEMLGITVHPLSIYQLNSLIAQAIEEQHKWIIANHNLHSIYIYHHSPRMRAFYTQANYIHIDGMALVFLGKFLGFSLQRQHRVTYVDWTNPLMTAAAAKSWRIFYLGSKPGVAEQGAKILRSKFSGLEIVTAHGYFDASPQSYDNQAILKQINQYNPDILMVGMGMPRQENWILDNLEHISARVILPCGATIDYVAGVVPTPPRWAGKSGLEWLFRLLAEPRRLWKRYLVEPWFLLLLLLIELGKISRQRWFKR